MVVGSYQGGKYVKAAEIVTAINNQTGQGTILLSADVIDIDGLVPKLTTQDITAYRLAATDTISMGNVSMTYQGLNIGDSTFRFNGSTVSWQTVTINGTTITYLGA